MTRGIDRIQAEIKLGSIIKRLVLLSTTIRPEDLIPLCDNLHNMLSHAEGKINHSRKPKTLARKLLELLTNG